MDSTVYITFIFIFLKLYFIFYRVLISKNFFLKVVLLEMYDIKYFRLAQVNKNYNNTIIQ